MELETFRREKLVILPARSTVYQAARAMAENHIGAVLVSRSGELVGMLTDRDIALAVAGEGLDAGATAVEEVMTEGVVSCPVGAGTGEALRRMAAYGVRRLPLLQGERVVGMVTLDDLLLQTVPPDLRAIRTVMEAQLVDTEARLKPAGVPHPVRVPEPGQRMRARMRAQARAEQVQQRLVRAVADASGLDPARAERGLKLGVCMLCHRLTPEEAQHTLAQLPSRLHSSLAACADGPDRAITASALQHEIGHALGLDAGAAAEFLLALFSVLEENISAGQIQEVKAQLPPDLRDLFPAARAA